MSNYVPPITWLRLFTQAATMATIIQDNDTLQPRDADKIATACMFFLADLSSKQVNIRSFVTEQFQLTAAKRQYLWGPTASLGNFISPRPTQILNAQLLITPGFSGSISQELDIWTKDQYYTLTDYLSTPGTPELIFPEYTYPNAVISFYGIPDQTYMVEMTSLKELAFMGNFTDYINLENIYLSVLLNGLVIWISGMFGKQVNPEIKDAYDKSLAQLLDYGWVEPVMRSNFPLPTVIGGGDIISGPGQQR